MPQGTPGGNDQRDDQPYGHGDDGARGSRYGQEGGAGHDEGAPAHHAAEGDRPDVKPGKIFLPGRCDVILFRHISSPLPAPGTAAALSAEHISCVSGKTAGSD